MKQLLCGTLLTAAMLAVPQLIQAQATATFSTGTFTTDSVLALTGPASSEIYGIDWLSSGPTTTANGYTFSMYSSGNLSYGSGNTDPVFFPSPNTTGDAGLDSVLNAAADQGISGSPNFTLNNLTSGVTYDVLLLDSDVRNGIGGPRAITVNDNLGDTITGAQWRTASTAVLEGSYVLATFTASGTTESFDIGGSGGPQVNAVLVTSVPEPTSCALALSGLGTLILLRRKVSHA